MGLGASIGGHNQHVAYTFKASADLSDIAHLGKAVTRAGGFATNGREAVGILLSNADSGGAITVGIAGILPYKATNVISAGYALTVDGSAQFQALAVSNYEVGIAYGTQGAAATFT